MRLKLSLIIYLTCISYCNLTAQDYFPFPTDSAYWSIYSRKHAWNEPVYEDTFFYFLNGDTLVNDTLYSKVFNVIATSDVIDTLHAHPLGGLREEGKRIYFKAWEKEQVFSHHCIYWPTLEEVTLFRFDKDVGQQFLLNGHAHTVENIDSMLIGTEYRKRFEISSMGWWVEGIGSIGNNAHTLFNSICQTFEGMEFLLCYEDTITFYMGPLNNYGRCTDFIVGLNENVLDNFKVYPNPASTNIKFDIQNIPEIGDIELQFVNALGQKIYSIKNPSFKNGIIDVSKWKRGIYIGLLKVNNKILYRNLILIE